MGGVTVGEIKWTCGIPHISGVPHLPAILVALSWDTPCCTHIFDKKLCSSPPSLVLIFLLLTWKLAKTIWGRGGGGGGGGQKIPLLSQLTWHELTNTAVLVSLSWDTQCCTHIPTKRRALCPPPPCCFFCFWHATTTKTIKALFSWP